mgnify:CR=1 FL=1
MNEANGTKRAPQRATVELTVAEIKTAIQGMHDSVLVRLNGLQIAGIGGGANSPEYAAAASALNRAQGLKQRREGSWTAASVAVICNDDDNKGCGPMKAYVATHRKRLEDEKADALAVAGLL